MGIKFKVVVRRAVSRQQTANINAQHQKQSDIKTSGKVWAEIRIKASILADCYRESALQL
jgi:hypothetical protein